MKWDRRVLRSGWSSQVVASGSQNRNVGVEVMVILEVGEYVGEV